MQTDPAFAIQLLRARRATHESELLIVRVRRAALRHEYERIISMAATKIAESRKLLRS